MYRQVNVLSAKFLSTLLTIVFIAGNLFSQQQFQWLSDIYGVSSGHTTCAFLNLPKSAGALALGGASSGGEMDATDLPDFPSNSAFATRNTFAFTHGEWLMGMRKQYAGALFPVLDIGSFGVFAQLFTPGAINNARTIDEEIAHPSYLEYSFGTSYARALLHNRLSGGLSLSFVESRIATITGRTACGGASLTFMPYQWLLGRMSLSSFGKSIIYSGETAEPLPTRAALSTEIQPFYFMPQVNSFGSVTFGLGAAKIADEPLKGGTSLRVTHKTYGDIRAGFEHTIGTKPSFTGASFGASVKTSRFTIRGGWKYLSREFGPVWAISLLHDREELKRRTAEDYYQRAVQHYKKQRFGLCTSSAKRALKLDPNMWKAHALLSKMKSDILRSTKREIALVYTGNAQGTFVSPVDDGSLGGFDHQASVIASLRAQFPLTLSIETGNMLTSDIQMRRADFAASYLEYINYDAIGCGVGEVLYGVQKLIKGQYIKSQFIISNSTATTANLARHRMIERDGYRFFVASYVNPALIPGELQKRFVNFDPDLLINPAKNADVRILIAHDTWEHLRQMAVTLTGFDIIICGNNDQRFSTPMKIGSTSILSTGSGGKYVGSLVLRFDEERNITGMENKLYPLQTTIPPDTVISRKLAAFSYAVVPENLHSGTLQETEGTFAFVSNRDGRNGIYLKVIRQNAEFPLTRSIADTCDNPVVSFAAGAIACRASINGCRRLLIMNMDGTGKRYVADNLQVSSASFSPDGEWLYYAASKCGDSLTDLYRVKSEGGPSFPLVYWPDGSETAPSFSADGTAMIFGSNRDGTMQLYLTNSMAELPLRITDEAANYTSPVFSTDGTYIAYLSDVTNFGGRKDLWVFERKGGIHRRITQRSDVKEFCWLDDSRTIIFTMGAMHHELTSVHIESFRYQKLTASDSVRTWNERTPQVLRFEGKNHIVYTKFFTDDTESQIYRMLPDGSENTRIINSPASDWLPTD